MQNETLDPVLLKMVFSKPSFFVIFLTPVMIRYLFISIVCLIASCVHPQQKPEVKLVQEKQTSLEQFKFTIPQGWKIVHQTRNKELISKQIIKEEETLDNWTIMITAQTFLDAGKYELENFMHQIGVNARQNCGNVRLFNDTNGVQDGYQFSQKMLTCLPNQKTLQNERMNIKAIKGKQAFYVLKIAYRTQLNRDEVFYWMAYLKDVTVVSTRP